MKTIIILLIFCSSCSLLKKDQKLDTKTDFDEFWNYSKLAEIREKFLKVLKDANQTQTKDYILQSKTQIARTHGLSLEFTEAHEVLDEVEKELDDSTNISEVRYLLERGRTYNSAKEITRAFELFVSAFHLAKKYELDNYTIDAAHMVAIAAPDLDEKVKWSELGISAAKESKNEKVKGWIGVFYKNMGWDLFEAKRYNEALVKF